MQIVIRQIPNFITIINLVIGSLAVFFAIDGHLIWAGIFICISAIFDYLDGLAARLLNAYSDLGKQLDSFSDLVSFGLAPGAILFTLLEFSLFKNNQKIYEISANSYEWVILFSAFLIPAFGALRLARFNTQSSNSNYFKGLPIPANGLLWASLGLTLEFSNNQALMEMIYSTKNLVLIAIFCSGLMIINLPMFSLKFHSFNFKENWHRFLFITIAIPLVLSFKAVGLFFVIVFYIILNLILYLLRLKV